MSMSCKTFCEKSRLVAMILLLTFSWGAHSWSDTLIFGPPSPVNSNAFEGDAPDRFPSIATDGAGTWIVVWSSEDSLGDTIGTDQDVLYAVSVDNGETWTPAAPLNTNAASDGPINARDDQFPKIVTDRAGNWIAVWTVRQGDRRDIFASLSTNNGATWSDPVAVNSDEGAVNEVLDVNVELATDGNGNWIAVWERFNGSTDPTGLDSDIFVARSSDLGATWTPLEPLNAHALTDGPGDFDVIPHISTDGAGNWVVAWTSDYSLGGTIGDDFDILFSRSTDNGVTWTSPEALNSDAATDSFAGGTLEGLVTDGGGVWIAAWTAENALNGALGNDGDVLFSRSIDNGLTWSPVAPLNTDAFIDNRFDTGIRIETDRAGTWVAAWSFDSGVGRDLFYSNSFNGGSTWSNPIILNSNALFESGSAGAPQIAADTIGNWIIVWESEDSLGGMLSGDDNILAVTATVFNATRTWNEYD